MRSRRTTLAAARFAQDQAQLRVLLGRLAGLLFVSGALASSVANQVLHEGPVPSWAHALVGVALASAVICFLLPFGRLPAWVLHLVVGVATLEVALTVAANGTDGGPFAWYFVLIAVFAGYAFRSRGAIAGHLALVGVGIALPATGLWEGPPLAAVTALVAIPVLLVSAATFTHLRETLERRHAELTKLAELNHALLERSRLEALTDPLSGLANRRRLLADLEQAFAAPEAAPRVLALFDLDGFKHYNDTFGHPAGDALLALLGRRLAEAVDGQGGAYRLGGDEFCVLLDPGVAADVVIVAGEALTESGEGFTIGSSSGAVRLPDEAGDASSALQVADRRLYLDKDSRRASAHRQACDVLLRLLRERRPQLGKHHDLVADLARDVGRELGLDGECLEVVVRAAQLHDIGKAAIPEAILDKPGPLDDEEWTLVRRHPEIGERILAAAPALASIAQLVRSSHERWDGMGYPDGLAGEAIPLGSRIVAICDAYEAMTSPSRAHRTPRSPDDALASLSRWAGTQFDPAVVEAFARARAGDAPEVPAVTVA